MRHCERALILVSGLPTSVEQVVRQAVLSWFCVDVKLCDEALCQGTSGRTKSKKSFASCPIEKRSLGEFQPRTAADQSSKGSLAFNCDPPLRLKNNYWSEKSCFLSLVGEGTLAASRGFPRYVNRSSNEKACGMLKVRSRVAVSTIIILAAFGEAAPGWKLSMNLLTSYLQSHFLVFVSLDATNTSIDSITSPSPVNPSGEPKSDGNFSLQHPAINFALEHSFEVGPDVDQISYGFFGHGVNLVPLVWPNARCIFQSHMRAPGLGSDPTVLGRPDHILDTQLGEREVPKFWFVDNLDLQRWIRFVEWSAILPDTIVWFTDPGKLTDPQGAAELRKLRKRMEKHQFTTCYWDMESTQYGSGLSQERLTVVMQRNPRDLTKPPIVDKAVQAMSNLLLPTGIPPNAWMPTSVAKLVVAPPRGIA
jgi:hypothetical protein